MNEYTLFPPFSEDLEQQQRQQQQQQQQQQHQQKTICQLQHEVHTGQ